MVKLLHRGLGACFYSSSGLGSDDMSNLTNDGRFHMAIDKQIIN